MANLFENPSKKEQGKNATVSTPADAQVDKAKEAAKKRRKDLKDGKIQLSKADFEKIGGDTWQEDFATYQKILAKKEETAREEWDDASWIKDELTSARQNLHAHDRFKKYTGVKRGVSAKASGIEQLDKVNELSGLVQDAFSKWAETEQTIKDFNSYLESLSLDESAGKPEFVVYCKGFNPVKKVIKKEFGKK